MYGLNFESHASYSTPGFARCADYMPQPLRDEVARRQRAIEKVQQLRERETKEWISKIGRIRHQTTTPRYVQKSKRALARQSQEKKLRGLKAEHVHLR